MFFNRAIALEKHGILNFDIKLKLFSLICKILFLSYNYYFLQNKKKIILKIQKFFKIYYNFYQVIIIKRDLQMNVKNVNIQEFFILLHVSFSSLIFYVFQKYFKKYFGFCIFLTIASITRKNKTMYMQFSTLKRILTGKKSIFM